MILSIEQLMELPKAADVTEVVDVPEWGGAVTIRALSLAQRDEMLHECGRNAEQDSERWNTLVLVNGLADPVVSYDQAVQLRQLQMGPVARLIDRIWDLSGLTPAGHLAKEAVDEAEETFRD